MNNVEFVGNIEGTPGQKTSLLLDVAKRSPLYFKTGMDLVRAGGLRDFHGFSIEKIGQNERDEPIIGIKERGLLVKPEGEKRDDTGFRGMSQHCGAVLLTGDSLGQMLNISPNQQDILTTSLLAHDASKRLEVLMQGFWKLTQINAVTPEVEHLTNEILSIQGFDSQENRASKIADKIKYKDAWEFADFFDALNRDFIERNLAFTSLPYEDQKSIATVSTSDTFGSLPRIIACTRAFSSDIQDDPTFEWFRSFSDRLESENKIPEVHGDSDDFLSLIVWYADSIVQGTTIKLVDDRLTQAANNYPEIHQAARKIFGMSFYEACIPTVHVMERIFTKRAKEINKLPAFYFPEELPIGILDNLQRRI